MLTRLTHALKQLRPAGTSHFSRTENYRAHCPTDNSETFKRISFFLSPFAPRSGSGKCRFPKEKVPFRARTSPKAITNGINTLADSPRVVPNVTVTALVRPSSFSTNTNVKKAPLHNSNSSLELTVIGWLFSTVTLPSMQAKRWRVIYERAMAGVRRRDATGGRETRRTVGRRTVAGTPGGRLMSGTRANEIYRSRNAITLEQENRVRREGALRRVFTDLALPAGSEGIHLTRSDSEREKKGDSRQSFDGQMSDLTTRTFFYWRRLARAREKDSLSRSARTCLPVIAVPLTFFELSARERRRRRGTRSDWRRAS